MTCSEEKELTRERVLGMLFGAFDKGHDQNRLAIYSKLLEDVPVQILSKAVKKLILESKFLPAISEIVEAAESLIGSVDDNRRIKTWAEAWGEIERAMFATPWGRKSCF